MATITNTVRWADNTAEFTRNLQQGLDRLNDITTQTGRSIGTVATELDKAKAHVTELMGVLRQSQNQPGLVAGLSAELDKALPKVAMLEAELRGMTATVKTSGDNVGLFGRMLSGTTGLLTTFGISLGVGSVISFGKSIVDNASSLVDMSEKTGMSIKGLQELQLAGQASGVSIEQISSAMNQFQKRMEEDMPKATQALNDIGLTLADIEGLTPDEQFMKVAEAIRLIPDPMKQTQVAMELFGKSGAQLLPMIKEGFDGVRDAVGIMSDETVKAMDEAGDTVERWYTQMKGLAAEAIVFTVRAVFKGATKEGGVNPDYANAEGLAPDYSQPETATDFLLKQEFFGGPVAGAGISESDRAKLDAGFERIQKKGTDEAKRLAEELDKVQRAGYQDAVAMQIMAGELDKIGIKDKSVQELGTALEALPGTIAKVNAELAKTPKSLQEISDILPKDSTGFFLPSRQTTGLVGTLGQGAYTEPPGLREKLTAQLKPLVGDLNGVFERAFEGGGGVGGALQSMGTRVLQMGLKLIPGIGPFISQFSGAITAGLKRLLGGLGGPDEKEQEGRKVVADFEKQFGSAEEMINKVGAAYIANGKSAEEAQRAIQRMWDAEKKGAKETAEAIAEVNEMLKRASEIDADLGSLGIKSHDELVHAADIANATYEKIHAGVATGQFTVEDEAKAYMAYQKALAATGDAAAAAWVKAHEAVMAATAGPGGVNAQMTAAEQELQGLINQHNSLKSSVDAEAQEAVMGSTEAKQREQLAALDDQIKQKADAYAQLADQTGQAMKDAIVAALQEIHIDPIHIGVVVDRPGTPGAPTEHTEVQPPTGESGPPIGIAPGEPGPDTFTPGDILAWTGGIVRSGYLQRFEGGGFVMNAPSSLRPSGPDTQLVWTSPGELIMNAAQQRNVANQLLGGSGLIAELRAIRRALASQPDTVVNVDGSAIARAYHRRLDHNTGGLLTDAQNVLGIA